MFCMFNAYLYHQFASQMDHGHAETKTKLKYNHIARHLERAFQPNIISELDIEQC